MSIKNVKPTLKTGYRQGYFTPNHPEKYLGNPTEIIYRSSWEFKFMEFCDSNEKVLSWGSESTPIPYFNPILKKECTYWIDCYMQVKNNNGSVTKWLIEVKPGKYLSPPKEPTRLTEKQTLNFARHAKTYLINSFKFKAAQNYASQNNMKFGIITENFLFNQV